MPYSCVAQNIRIWSITATEPRFAQAAHIGGYVRASAMDSSDTK